MSLNKARNTNFLGVVHFEDAVSLKSHYVEQSVRSSISEACNDVRSTSQDRIMSLLLDYKQFKSARTIQRHLRGWLCRKKVAKTAAAVTTISRWWRGYRVRKSIYGLVEAKLQAQLLAHYNEQAVKIQTLYRGWHTRQFVQDFNGLHQLQLQLAEDLISCLARSLREAQLNNQLPGIYSLREEGKCLGIIEDLARTFSYRFHNGRVVASIAKRRSYLEECRRNFDGSAAYTEMPYPGPGAVLGTCAFNVDFNEPGFSKDADVRLQRFILLFENAKRDKHVAKVRNVVASKLRQDVETSLQEQKEKNINDYCKYVFDRLSPGGLDKDTAVKDFLDSLLSSAEELNCHCQPKMVTKSLCH